MNNAIIVWNKLRILTFRNTLADLLEAIDMDMGASNDESYSPLEYALLVNNMKSICKSMLEDLESHDL
jgi:hypothetical protein